MGFVSCIAQITGITNTEDYQRSNCFLAEREIATLSKVKTNWIAFALIDNNGADIGSKQLDIAIINQAINNKHSNRNCDY